jgi:hypothetical protein
MTENIMASAGDGGWYLNSTTVVGRITELTANTSSSPSQIMRFKVINNSTNADITSSNVGWTVLTIREQNLGGDVTRLKSSYASFNSSENLYQWSASAGDQDVLGSTSGLTRYLQLD